MWQNTAFVRFHYQIDDIKRYAQRIPNYEMFKIAQCLSEYRYLQCNDKRFYCYIASDDNYITGNFTKRDFEFACRSYLESNPRRVNDAQKKFGTSADGREKSVKLIMAELFQKYYRGI
jgi:hypothetical protein